MKFLIYCAIISCFLSSVKAQRCDTYNYAQKNTPALINLDNSRVVIPPTILKDEVITIPVVIHLLYNNATENISDAQILSQLDALNKDFRRLNSDTINTPKAFAAVAADAKITFCLAKRDPNGRRTTGIIRKYTSVQNWLADDEMKYAAQGGDNAWDCKKYLNIWVCNLFGRTLGYSSLPGSQPDKDGLVVKYNVFGTIGTVGYPFNKGRTVTHEVGHWLGLIHVWGDKACGDDGVEDTPPQQSYNNGCPSFPHKSACSINSNGDMFMNFMDLTDDGCMNMFSIGQKNKMRSLFATGGVRNSFLNANGCDSSNTVEAGPLPTEAVTTPAAIEIYPNPVVDKLIIKSNAADLNKKEIRIINVVGKVMMIKILTGNTNTITVANLPTGIYILQIGGSSEKQIFMILKQ